MKALKTSHVRGVVRRAGSSAPAETCLRHLVRNSESLCNDRRGRPRTAWMDDIKTWTGLYVEESIRMTEDRDKWRKYVHGVANPRIEDG